LADNESSGLKIFGAGLRHLRRKLNKTIAAAAKDAKMTLSVYHKIEVGQRGVYAEEIEPLAKSFGKTAESLFKSIADLYSSGELTKQINKVEEKVKSVLIPGNPMSGLDMSGSLYGAKIYDSARKKLVPIFGHPDEKGIAFKKSDEKMIVAPENLEGKSSVYAVIPNVRRLGGAFPARAYLFVDSEVTAQPGDMAIALNEKFDKIAPDTRVSANLVIVREDAKGKLFGQVFNPDEKIDLGKGSVHKVVQILMD